MPKEVIFYSRAAALMIMRPDKPKIEFQPMNLRPMVDWGGNNWGTLTTSSKEVIDFLNARREAQGEDLANRDVLDQTEWNTEFNIETKGARKVLDDVMKRDAAHNRLIDDLIAAGKVKLDANGLPVMVAEPKKDDPKKDDPKKDDPKKDDPPANTGAVNTGIASTATKK